MFVWFLFVFQQQCESAAWCFNNVNNVNNKYSYMEQDYLFILFILAIEMWMMRV